jgi:hypothetical protein
MTYRDGGKVKTRNKYLGPASSAGAALGFGAPASLPIAESKPPKQFSGLKLDKIRRLKPRTRAFINREAARRRFEEEARLDLDELREARRSQDPAVQELKRTDSINRRAYKIAFGRSLKLRKNVRIRTAIA